MNHTGPVRLLVAAHQVEAETENVSRTDLKVHSEAGLAVTVEVEEDGVIKRVPGHVVRLESSPGEGSSWVIEFD